MLQNDNKSHCDVCNLLHLIIVIQCLRCRDCATSDLYSWCGL